MYWGTSLFYVAMSLLNWYKMACMGDILHKLIWMKFISLLSMYGKFRIHMHFHWRIIVVQVLLFWCLWISPVPPKAEICGNMGIYCGFRAVAAREKYRGFILFKVKEDIKCFITLTHWGREDLWKWAIFNTILTSPKSWLSQEDLDAGCEHSLVPVDS